MIPRAERGQFVHSRENLSLGNSRLPAHLFGNNALKGIQRGNASDLGIAGVLGSMTPEKGQVCWGCWYVEVGGYLYAVM